ncbi:uncharacterized protein [Enoplosus armatus]|uniref:uncharacterized protein n=1 Tax=Enoplosus armatus TaxID=215367 RepID=UPI003994E668
MKMKLLYVTMVVAVMSALVLTNFGLETKPRPKPKPKTTTAKPTTTTAKPTTTAVEPTSWTRTTGTYGQNLNGKMFTLSLDRGGISFYPPYYSPPTPPSYTTTHSWNPTTTTSPPWTTEPSTRGVSVCLRYLTDSQASGPSIFTLSPSSRILLKLTVTGTDQFSLFFDRYHYDHLYFKPDIWFWSNVGSDIWTRVCLTLDAAKNVAQVFSGSRISIRKMLPIQYAWLGEPVIDFSGFDGQVTDVQVWDYPLRYKEVFNYMTSGVYMPYRGSVLTWSSISYSPRGSTLLEDIYEAQARQPISSRGGRRLPKGEKKTWELLNGGEREERKMEQL